MNHPSDFLHHIMDQFYVRIHNIEADNYDSERFSHKTIDKSQTFDIPRHKDFLFHFISKCTHYFNIYQLLEDKYSKHIYCELILYKLLGHLHVKLPTNNPHHWEVRQAAHNLKSINSIIKCKGIFGSLYHFNDISFQDTQISVDCWWSNVAWSFLFKQYYLERDEINVKPEPGDYAIDAGACFGDTALAFAATVGPKGFVYTFDPLEGHIKIIEHNIKQNKHLKDNIRLFPYALGSISINATKSSQSEEYIKPGFSIDHCDEPNSFSTTTIDNLIHSGDIKRVDFIKMDIEGYELKALQGAEKALRKFKPKLAISLYHKLGDMYEIPLYINNLNLGYIFFVDHYTIHSEETILYAISTTRS